MKQPVSSIEMITPNYRPIPDNGDHQAYTGKHIPYTTLLYFPSQPQPTTMTRINTPTSLPHPISAFLHAFYRASDTSPHTNPSANALYADFFTDDAPLLMGSQTFHGRQGFLSFREGGWEKVREREHVVLDVFARPSAREGEDTELMIRGTVEYGMKDGSAGHADWAGFMKLRWLEEEGGYKLAFYQVWIVSREMNQIWLPRWMLISGIDSAMRTRVLERRALGRLGDVDERCICRRATMPAHGP